MLFRIKKGLDLPIGGAPEQVISDGPPVASVALLGRDYVGVRPRLLVGMGDRVKLGQPLFADRKRPEILFTSPGSGTVSEIDRGERRSVRSIAVALDGAQDEAHFAAYSPDELTDLRPDQVRDNLLASGLWTAFRTRPYGKVPDPGSEPHSIFVTAVDSNPLAAKPSVVIDACRQDFADGLAIVAHLTAGPVYLCKEPGANLPAGDPQRVRVAEFAGPHPSGLAGTHIHFLDPVSARKTVWYLDYQDVIAVGRLFKSGRLPVERIVALAGPPVQRPRLIRTRLGAAIDDLTQGEVPDRACRVISGSVLSGHEAAGSRSYLGRYHSQVTIFAEGLGPDAGQGAANHQRGSSPVRILRSLLSRRRGFAARTPPGRPASTMLPMESFEKVMPLDILPVPLLRALLVGDTDMAQSLGCLELDEEDLALTTFLCPGNNEYGPLLRSCLARIEKEG